MQQRSSLDHVCTLNEESVTHGDMCRLSVSMLHAGLLPRTYL